MTEKTSRRVELLARMLREKQRVTAKSKIASDLFRAFQNFAKIF